MPPAFRPSLELIFRLLCLAQLFECLRPFVLEGVAQHYASGGLTAALSQWFAAAPLSRWGVYAMSAMVLFVGPRTALLDPR